MELYADTMAHYQSAITFPRHCAPGHFRAAESKFCSKSFQQKQVGKGPNNNALVGKPWAVMVADMFLPHTPLSLSVEWKYGNWNSCLNVLRRIISRGRKCSSKCFALVPLFCSYFDTWFSFKNRILLYLLSHSGWCKWSSQSERSVLPSPHVLALKVFQSCYLITSSLVVLQLQTLPFSTAWH